MQQNSSSFKYDEKNLVNQTTDITKIFLIVSSVIGIPGNILSILTYLRLNRYTKTNMPFLFILQSLIDFILLTLTLFVFRGSFLLLDTRIYFISDTWCKLWSFFRNYLLHISSWTLVLTTVDRFLFVVFEKRIKFIKDKRILTAIVLIMFTLIAVADIGNFFYYLSDEKSCLGNSAVKKSSTIISSLLYFYIPMGLMVLLNSVTVYKMVKNLRIMNRQASLSKRERRFTVFVLVYDVLFFLSKAPLSIFFIIYYINIDSAEFEFKQLLKLVLNIVFNISCFNQICSFFISLTFNKAFRREFFRFVKCKPPRSPPRVSFAEPIIIRF